MTAHDICGNSAHDPYGRSSVVVTSPKLTTMATLIGLVVMLWVIYDKTNGRSRHLCQQRSWQMRE